MYHFGKEFLYNYIDRGIMLAVGHCASHEKLCWYSVTKNWCQMPARGFACEREGGK
jgi:hypothetical protein